MCSVLAYFKFFSVRTCPYFRIVIIMILVILLLRARVLSHNPKVKSLQFETRCGKNLVGDFPILEVIRAKV